MALALNLLVDLLLSKSRSMVCFLLLEEQFKRDWTGQQAAAEKKYGREAEEWGLINEVKERGG